MSIQTLTASQFAEKLAFRWRSSSSAAPKPFLSVGLHSPEAAEPSFQRTVEPAGTAPKHPHSLKRVRFLTLAARLKAGPDTCRFLKLHCYPSIIVLRELRRADKNSQRVMRSSLSADL